VILKNGSRGQRVKELQNLLKSVGYWSLDYTTENFGGVTETAVKKFQKDKGLKDDGIVGPATWSKLTESSLNKIKPVYEFPSDSEDFSDPEDEMLIEKIKELYPTCKI
jgi:peptidoglycan hydrolase-like protein with peptidoglycan-binding domain